MLWDFLIFTKFLFEAIFAKLAPGQMHGGVCVVSAVSMLLNKQAAPHTVQCEHAQVLSQTTTKYIDLQKIAFENSH